MREKNKWWCPQTSSEWRKPSLRHKDNSAPLVPTSSPLNGAGFLERNRKLHTFLPVSSSLVSQHREATVGLDSTRMGIERALWYHLWLSSGDYEDFILLFLPMF